MTTDVWCDRRARHIRFAAWFDQSVLAVWYRQQQPTEKAAARLLCGGGGGGQLRYTLLLMVPQSYLISLFPSALMALFTRLDFPIINAMTSRSRFWPEMLDTLSL
jgi:hypothetical protein